MSNPKKAVVQIVFLNQYPIFFREKVLHKIQCNLMFFELTKQSEEQSIFTIPHTTASKIGLAFDIYISNLLTIVCSR